MSYLDLCNDALGSLGPVLLASLPLLGICQKIYLFTKYYYAKSVLETESRILLWPFDRKDKGFKARPIDKQID